MVFFHISKQGIRHGYLEKQLSVRHLFYISTTYTMVVHISEIRAKI